MYKKLIENHIKKRVEWLDILKGVTIILVVLRHIMQSNITDYKTNIVGNFIFAIQMPLFMIVSGYFSVTASKYYENMTNVLSYIVKRAIRYLLPFFSWFVVIQVFLFGKYDRNLLYALKNLIYNIDLGLWFLYVIFILSVLQILSKWICEKFLFNQYFRDIISVILTGILLIPLLALGLKTGIRFLGINLIIYYYLFFAIGHLFFCFNEIIKRILKQKKVQISAFVVFGVAIITVCLNFNVANLNDSIIEIFLRVVSAITGCSTVTILVYWMSNMDSKFNNILKFIGKYTLEIYVTHLYFIGLLKKGKYYLFTLQGLGIFTLALGITVVLTVVTIWIIKKIWFLYFILYGKIPNNVAKVRNKISNDFEAIK